MTHKARLGNLSTPGLSCVAQRRQEPGGSEAETAKRLNRQRNKVVASAVAKLLKLAPVPCSAFAAAAPALLDAAVARDAAAGCVTTQSSTVTFEGKTAGMSPRRKPTASLKRPCACKLRYGGSALVAQPLRRMKHEEWRMFPGSNHRSYVSSRVRQ